MQMHELIIGFISICTNALLCTFGHLTPEPAKLGIFEPFGPMDQPQLLIQDFLLRFPEKFSPYTSKFRS